MIKRSSIGNINFQKVGGPTTLNTLSYTVPSGYVCHSVIVYCTRVGYLSIDGVSKSFNMVGYQSDGNWLFGVYYGTHEEGSVIVGTCSQTSRSLTLYVALQSV